LWQLGARHSSFAQPGYSQLDFAEIAVSEQTRSTNITSPNYAASGVAVDTVESGLSRLADHVRSTWGARQGDGAVRLDLGYFANVIELAGQGIAICTDGIGTKALIAQMMERYDTVGIDCVAMNVNDLLCVGAKPVSMVDYIAIEDADPVMIEQLGKGLADGAKMAGISISGGEIAQMRDVIKGAKPGTGFDLDFGDGHRFMCFGMRTQIGRAHV